MTKRDKTLWPEYPLRVWKPLTILWKRCGDGDLLIGVFCTVRGAVRYAKSLGLPTNQFDITFTDLKK